MVDFVLNISSELGTYTNLENIYFRWALLSETPWFVGGFTSTTPTEGSVPRPRMLLN